MKAVGRFIVAVLAMTLVGAVLATTYSKAVAPLVVLGVCVSFVALIRPLPVRGMRTRSSASGILLGSVLILPLIFVDHDTVKSVEGSQTEAQEQNEQPTKQSSVKKFIDKDFYWDDETAPYKKAIIEAVNRIHRENSRCAEIDPTSVARSPSKSQPGKPVFFVTCGAGAGVFNVWFSEDDLTAGERFEAAPHIPKAQAVTLCEGYAKSVATHPSSVEFSRLIDLVVAEHPNGRTTVSSKFTARNSLNLEAEFQIKCLLNSAGLIEATVTETR